MKNKLLKVVSSVIIICLIIGTLMPTMVKSVEVVVSNMTDTGHGVGSTKIFKAQISGFNNIYCVRGGAHLKSGTVLNDDGLSLYNTTGEVVKNSSAIQWLFDNMYLIDEKDEAVKTRMKKNLVKIVKEYSTYKDSNGNNALSKKIGVSASTINDEWINNMVNALLGDTNTLYAVQQYVIWNNVYNYVNSYTGTMRNSDGTYNSIPGAKVDKKYYVALYATLDELSKVAQVNGYTSPNNPGANFDIKIQKQNSTKVTLSDDLKTAMVGPYKLQNNHKFASKSFYITVDSNKVDEAQIVNKDGKDISTNMSESKGEFWIKIKYNKGFEKGVKHNINIDVKLEGHKTYAKLLDAYDEYNQPVVALRTQKYSSSTKTDIYVEQKLEGDYGLELEKVDSTNNKKKIQGVTFKVKDGDAAAKTYGPTDANGMVKIFESKSITEEGIDEYTITEVSVGEKEYVKLNKEIKFYVTKSKSNNAYVASAVSFEKDKKVTNKTVELQDGSKAVLTAAISGNMVKITIPNKPIIKPTYFDMALRKNISEVKRNGETIDIGEDRTPSINLYSSIEYAKNRTAGYYHTKNVVNVKPGDTIIYTIRVYNEGYFDGYAKQITDYLPAGLEFVKDSQINRENNWQATENVDGTTTVTTNKLENILMKAGNGAEGFALYASQQSNNEQKSDPDFCKSIQLECKVKEDVQDSKLLVNIAEITNYGFINGQGNYVEANRVGIIDIDSEQNNVFENVENINSKIDQYYNEIVKPQYSVENNYYKGKQDDDDFENIVVQPDVNEFKFVLNKVDEEGNPLIGADFTVERFKDNDNEVLLDNKEVKGTYEVLESNVKFNNTYTYKVVEVESAPQYVNVMEGKYITIQTYMNNDKDLVLGVYKAPGVIGVTDEDGYYEKYGFTINNQDGSIVTENETDLYEKIKVAVKNDTEPSQVTITIPNEKEVIPGKYNVQIKKVDAKDSNKVLQGAVFTVLDKNKISSDVTTGVNGIATVAENVDITKTEEGKTSTDNYVITEKTVPEGYVLIKDYNLLVSVTTGLAENKKDYEVKNVEVNISQKDGSEESAKEKEMLEKGVSKTISGNTITITIPNEEEVIPGKYNIQIKKVDANDSSKTLQGAVFTVLDRNKISSEITTAENGVAVVAKNVDITKTEEGKTSIGNYVITEKTVPEGYVLIKDHSLIVSVTTGLAEDKKDYEVKNVEVNIAQKGGSPETAKEREMLEKGVSKTIDGNTITITIPNMPEEKDFDLALRKFITGVNDKEVTTRIPVFKIDENGNYVYNHDKEPVLVANSNIVTYTLRVYNEGEVAGYAREIKDDIPNGLEFLPDNDLNKEYRWLMLDKYGKETDNVDDAKYITTDYLSKEQEETEGSNLLKPFDEEAYEAGSIKEPDYKEVKVAFKVNVPDKSEEIIINKAQISDDSDENGDKIEDKDSTTNEWIDGEDDQDIEKIKVQYFDLALRKWVTKAIVTENGQQTIHETGHKAEDDPEAVVKVDLNKSNINNVTVKFEYKIRIENQGKIAGYAKEISDYIPEGLKFVKEDNPQWKEVDGKVVTDQLKDTLLQPGETAEVSILLTWINREDNMGLKVNTAEISKDYNEYGAKDIDSTPNNKVQGEDDIDDAPVMLTVKTGEEPVYAILATAVLGILATGLILIKKYVL